MRAGGLKIKAWCPANSFASSFVVQAVAMDGTVVFEKEALYKGSMYSDEAAEAFERLTEDVIAALPKLGQFESLL